MGTRAVNYIHLSNPTINNKFATKIEPKATFWFIIYQSPIFQMTALRFSTLIFFIQKIFIQSLDNGPTARVCEFMCRSTRGEWKKSTIFYSGAICGESDNNTPATIEWMVPAVITICFVSNLCTNTQRYLRNRIPSYLIIENYEILLQIILYHYSALVYRAVGSVRAESCNLFFDDSGQHTVFWIAIWEKTNDFETTWTNQKTFQNRKNSLY